MRVALFPQDETGCGLHRIYYPARAAEASGGVEVSFSRSIPIKRSPRNLSMIGVRVEADAAVVHRPTLPETLQAIGLLQRRGIAVVVEIDDDIAAVSPAHPAFGNLHPRLNPGENWKFLKRACRMADMVTVPTSALARVYGQSGRVAVLPNCVPEALLSMPRSSDGRTVGWAGATRVHPGDLPVTRGGVAEAVRAHGRFHVVGPADGVQEQLSLDDEPTATGGITPDEYDLALGELDVGIVPLADTRFNRSKSCLKGIQYAARGVAFLASPVAEYERLAGQGVGFLAPDRARNWRSLISALLTDEARRVEVAAAGREVVAERFTYERNGWRWAEAWERAVENRRAAGRERIAA